MLSQLAASLPHTHWLALSKPASVLFIIWPIGSPYLSLFGSCSLFRFEPVCWPPLDWQAECGFLVLVQTLLQTRPVVALVALCPIFDYLIIY